MDKQKLEEAEQLAYSMTCHPLAYGTIDHTEQAGEMLRELLQEVQRLRAALTELLACNTESAGWSMSMVADRAAFDAMLARSQARLDAAVSAAREVLGPNVGANLRAEGPSS